MSRPLLAIDDQYRTVQDSSLDEKFRGDYLAGANLIYKGFARPGVLTSEPFWQIAKLSYDGNNNVLTIDWAQTPLGVASNDYVFVWDNRTTYTYS